MENDRVMRQYDLNLFRIFEYNSNTRYKYSNIVLELDLHPYLKKWRCYIHHYLHGVTDVVICWGPIKACLTHCYVVV